jgi:large subunit ribosomal protein L3
MTVGLVGRKCGMTRVFTEDGVSIPVTVIEVLPNRITQVKVPETDGYRAIQVTTGTRKKSRLVKPEVGHFAKAKVEPGRGLWEFRLDDSVSLDAYVVGGELKADIFSVGQVVDVTGVSKGKGFAGTIKRHNFTMGDATHGNSLSHRAPGSIGQRQSPGKVFKGKKMSGHMGQDTCTVQSQKVVRVDAEKNLVLVRGAVPGAPGCDVVIKPTVKVKKKKGDK